MEGGYGCNSWDQGLAVAQLEEVASCEGKLKYVLLLLSNFACWWLHVAAVAFCLFNQNVITLFQSTFSPLQGLELAIIMFCHSLHWHNRQPPLPRCFSYLCACNSSPSGCNTALTCCQLGGKLASEASRSSGTSWVAGMAVINGQMIVFCDPGIASAPAIFIPDISFPTPEGNVVGKLTYDKLERS